MSRVTGSATATTSEDPFGPGDPVEVARLVRRALASGGAKAMDVTALLVVADGPLDPAALARFTRRALGPHGASLALVAVPGRATSHAARRDAAAEVGCGFRDGPAGREGPDRRSVVIVVVLGPCSAATALCLGTGDGRRPA